jgi:UDP-arabinose 4-epimerase
MADQASVLVAGGAGFIGSHACKALAAAGLRPVAFDNLSTGHADAVRWGPLVEGDCRDADAVARALADHGASAVIHFAASCYVGESVQDPAKYYDNNVGGVLGLLEGCRRAGVARVVFSSSCATYGIPQALPIRETTPQQPINPYGRTKLIGEQILRDFAAYGLRHVALRYFNAAGADPEGELRERHDPETHLVPLALMAAAGTGPALTILGDDYPTPDGTCIRDYIHVADLSRAHVMAVSYLIDGGESVALNLGSGQGQSVRQVVEAVGRITGQAVPFSIGPRRPGDPPELVADPARAEATLGFRTQLSDIDTIIRDAAPSFGLSVRHG